MSDLDRVIDAHGGRERWQGMSRLLATLSLGGMEFVAHFQPRPFREVEVTLDPRAFRVTCTPFPNPGCVGVFDPQRVRLEDEDGGALEERAAPARIARSLRHWFLWDSLDVLYVSGMTLWHSLLLPLILARSGVACEPLGPVTTDAGRWQRYDVRFPADLPLPAAQQTLYTDGAGVIRRVDYAPVTYGSVMRVAQLLEGHESVDGRIIATRQTLHPCLPGGYVVRASRLAWLEASDLRVVADAPGGAESERAPS
ncbi:hypothetical protein [Sediminicurvatus halobius]|uniref:Uncharacterized protein n=1 Tax=Sediminicurvatus halobius TaxID=2182432 RepID=A0A2U2MYU6_9GAMM|nr:hypothetical protein [Spiribacter halobius]PWG61972.1 hypothetical protein DEM34_14005 [Spiribacter halobius]UEX78378.1 hypothetical protein LMH63_01680 [Spiribacter halobius]